MSQPLRLIKGELREPFVGAEGHTHLLGEVLSDINELVDYVCETNEILANSINDALVALAEGDPHRAVEVLDQALEEVAGR